jgi:FKBP-type peptidyl-prolyl cis-trans isomerase SlyD
MASDPIGRDQVVSIEFELRNKEGEVLDSSQEAGPLSYLHGHGQLFPAVEKALEGQMVGHEAEVEVPPDEGFGQRDKELVFDVPRDQLDFEPEAGQVLQAEGPGGVNAAVRIVAVGEKGVTLDGNHPLAEQEIVFKVKVVGARAATAEELSHGHSHDGHSHDCH